jgi:hypothetical protein
VKYVIHGVETLETKRTCVSTRRNYGWVRPAVSMEALKVNRQLTPLLKDLADVSKGEFVFFRQ